MSEVKTDDSFEELVDRLSARLEERNAKKPRSIRHVRRLSLVATTLVLGLAVGGVAFASVPDSTGVIHGCFAGGTPHSLQVIDTAKVSSCPSGTVALNWNQTGPRGPQGVQGQVGSQGPQGVQGPPGVSSTAYTFNPNVYNMDGSGQ